MYYNYIKALHLIFVITWFAGLFYIPRLFIYHTEASKKTKQEADILIRQLKIMSRRLWYIITWPSAILAIISCSLPHQADDGIEIKLKYIKSIMRSILRSLCFFTLISYEEYG